MVRINLVEPSSLSDQHLVAEYREILLLLGYVRKHQEISSKDAHFLKNPVRYFGDKLSYISKRHKLIRAEMKRRGFRHGLMPDLHYYKKQRMKGFKATVSQLKEVKARIINRLSHPPRKHFYHYYRKKVPTNFLIKLIRKAKSIS